MPQVTQSLQESVDAQHAQVRTVRGIPVAMGLTRYLLPVLGMRALRVVETLMIASLFLIQIAFLLIRQPLLLLDQNLLDASRRLLYVFLASPVVIGILAALAIGYFVTGVVLPDHRSPERWNVWHTLQATGIAAIGGLMSAALFIPGLLLPVPWGYCLVAAGFLLGPWFPVRFVRSAHQTAAPASSAWRSTWRAALRLLPLAIFLPLWAADIASILSVADNRLFLNEVRVANPDFTENTSQDSSIKVARLSTGLIRYRDMNSKARNIVLCFPGWQESIYQFPVGLQTKLEELDIRGIIIERPGIGPISTAWPGYGLAEWAVLVEEFDKTVLGGRPISIVGHSAGGVYALACAKLACVRALGLVASAVPMTYGSFLKMFFYDANLAATAIALQLFPHKLLPEVDRSCQQPARSEALVRAQLETCVSGGGRVSALCGPSRRAAPQQAHARP